jgi:predicted aconitase with swiveling domain
MELEGRALVSGRRRGSALVTVKAISFLGGVDPETGIITERDHDLEGESLKGRVLCFPHGHGSTVGSYVLYSLVRKGLGPKAIVNESADPVVVAGAIIADIPMVDQVDIKQIKTGDEIEVDGGKGTVTIVKRV